MLHDRLHSKCIEPVKRNKDGVRWIQHRFPIKGGITWYEAWSKEMRELFSKPSVLSALFKDKMKNAKNN